MDHHEAGEHEVTIVEVEPDVWRVRRSGAPVGAYLGFGPATYGGTFEEAERDAERVASKWGWCYLPPELEWRADGSIVYTPPTPGEGAGGRADRALRIAADALGGGEQIRLTLAEGEHHA